MTAWTYDDWLAMLRGGLSIIGVTALVVSGASAAASTDERPPPLLGDYGLSFWTLTQSADATQDTAAVFQFEGQLVSLDVPCHRSSWAYRYEAGLMTVTNPAGSESRCTGGAPPIIVTFNSTIPLVKAPRVSGDTLSLLDASGRPLFILQRLTATGLENRKWQISSFFDGTSLVPTLGRFTPPLVSHIIFMHGGVYGSPGCGGFLGRYSLLGQRVTITAMVLLAGLCPPGEFELSGTVANALNGQRVVERDGDGMVLHDPQGRIQIVLTPWEQRAH